MNDTYEEVTTYFGTHCNSNSSQTELKNYCRILSAFSKSH